MLTSDIWRFRHVQTVEDCVNVRANWLAEEKRILPDKLTNFYGPWQFGTEPADTEPLETPRLPYIAEQITDAIRAKAGRSRFDLTKLLALIAELNDNCASKHTYAAHALLRAVLDHVPPVFGYPDVRGSGEQLPVATDRQAVHAQAPGLPQSGRRRPAPPDLREGITPRFR